MYQKNKIKFQYQIDDVRLINKLKYLHPTDAWDHNKKHVKLIKKKLELFKQRIKIFLLKKHNEQCSYCKRSLRGEDSMVIDIEHILPKSVYKQYMFDVNQNLAISCRRCNFMKDRGKKYKYLKTKNQKIIFKNPYTSRLYKFIHPNLDDYFRHIEYDVRIRNDKQLVKYKRSTSKGRFTYKHFKLIDFEISSFSNLQGIEHEAKLSDKLSKYEKRIYKKYKGQIYKNESRLNKYMTSSRKIQRRLPK